MRHSLRGLIAGLLLLVLVGGTTVEAFYYAPRIYCYTEYGLREYYWLRIAWNELSGCPGTYMQAISDFFDFF